MIHWKEVEPPMTRGEQRRWLRTMCKPAALDNGLCEGYSRRADDDEPCEVCKACDKLGIEVKE